MSRFLLCMWLVGAALYTFTLLLTQSLHGLTVDETVRAKNLLADEVILPLTLRPSTNVKCRIEGVQAARYMAVIRVQPSATSPVLFASTSGRPLRVIGREADFVKVQNLGRGQLGWIEARAISTFIAGYRQREVTPVMVAKAQSEPKAMTATTHVTTEPQLTAEIPKPDARYAVTPPRAERFAVRETRESRLSKAGRLMPHRVVFRRHSGIAGMVQRTLFGRL